MFYDVTIAIGPTPTSINPICSLIAATDVELYYTMWSCDVDGQPITNPCSTQWTGLNCTNTTDIGIITSISLDAVGINGTIPSNIGQLTSLRELYLNNNTLTGSIPRNLFNLLNLITINLDRNKFTGIIPTNINKLNILQVLSMQHCQLVGPIPSTISSLTNLMQLYLTGKSSYW